MSASSQKNRRREERETGSDKRSKELLQKKKDAIKTRNTAIIVTAAFLIVALVVVLLNTPLMYGFTAIRCGDVNFSTSDYKYYYGTTYSSYYTNYYNSYGEYAQYFMPDAETLAGYTTKTMQETAALAGEAKAAGYQLSEAGQAQVDAAATSLASAAASNGYTRGGYLRAMYGAGVNLKVYLRNVEMSTLAAEYASYLRNSYEYSQEDLTNYYAENRDRFDVLTYRSYYFGGAAVEDNEETEEDETVTAEDAMAAAEANASEFLQRLENGESFVELAREYSGNSATYTEDDSVVSETRGESLSSSYSAWLLSDDRQENDAEIAITANGCYVVQYMSRNDNSYLTVNVRHILIMPDTVNKDDYTDTAAYDAAVKAAKDAAYEEAKNIYSTWNAGEKTEESFATLASQNSDDSSEGGLISQIYRGQTVEGFQNWCFDETRKPGDTDIVESTYGWHIMYYIGTDLPYCDIVSESAQRTADFTDWETLALEDYPLSTNMLYKLFC